MEQTLQIIQIASSVLLIILVLLQKANPDMGASLGGDGSSFLQTRRGAERFLFIFTIFVAIIFAGSSLLAVVLK
ncbi:MAG TPA: preprotein translocase subunit SecG [Candidatus Paceibacterota bacterium]|nr:preprotein translocase subunit SecG [Candidatus Paceibacterota bacterium]